MDGDSSGCGSCFHSARRKAHPRDPVGWTAQFIPAKSGPQLAAPGAVRKAIATRHLCIAALLCCAAVRAAGQQKPIPVGLDAYRAWARWDEQRIGMRAYMRSTYDRSGGNEGADASHFLYQLADDFNVTLDLEGAGILLFSRYNHWHGSPWHYVVDGKGYIVQESSTADPLQPKPDSTFLPLAPFPSPLNETWATTKGADLVWSPIPFERSFQMAY